MQLCSWLSGGMYTGPELHSLLFEKHQKLQDILCQSSMSVQWQFYASQIFTSLGSVIYPKFMKTCILKPWLYSHLCEALKFHAPRQFTFFAKPNYTKLQLLYLSLPKTSEQGQNNQQNATLFTCSGYTYMCVAAVNDCIFNSHLEFNNDTK